MELCLNILWDWTCTDILKNLKTHWLVNKQLNLYIYISNIFNSNKLLIYFILVPREDH